MDTQPAHGSLPAFEGTAKFSIPGLVIVMGMALLSAAGVESPVYIAVAIVPGVLFALALIAVVSNLIARRPGRNLEIMSQFRTYSHLSEEAMSEYGLTASRVGEWYLFFPVQLLITGASTVLCLWAATAWTPNGYF